MKLNELSDNPGARKERKRVGRGIGSGVGKTGGRGVKGQKSRSGVSGIRAYEGGQMPLYMRLPKRGFNKPNRLKFVELNIGRLQQAIDAGRVDAGQPITVASLVETGVVRRAHSGLRVLGTGALTTKITIEAVHVSEGAKAAIEKAGGSVTIVEAGKAAGPGASDAGDGFGDDIDMIVLIDGIGPKTEESLKAEGITKLTQFAAMAEDERNAMLEKLGLADDAKSQEWLAQAQEMIAGKPPRAKVDQALVKKIRAGKV